MVRRAFLLPLFPFSVWVGGLRMLDSYGYFFEFFSYLCIPSKIISITTRCGLARAVSGYRYGCELLRAEHAMEALMRMIAAPGEIPAGWKPLFPIRILLG